MARDTKKKIERPRWRLWLIGLTVVVGFTSTAVAALKVRHFAATSPSFILNRESDALTVQGLHYVQRSQVSRAFSTDFGHSIFSIPLSERRARLLAIDWIEDATVARIWPDRLLVRIRERKPVAFVSFRSGVLLIDAFGVLLDPPPLSQFSFPVLSGVREDQEESKRAVAVQTLLRLQRELGSHATDISEVNAADPDDVRLIARVDNHAVELLLGDSDFGTRYNRFLRNLPEIRKKSPDGKVFDLRLDDRITVKE